MIPLAGKGYSDKEVNTVVVKEVNNKSCYLYVKCIYLRPRIMGRYTCFRPVGEQVYFKQERRRKISCDGVSSHA